MSVKFYVCQHCGNIIYKVNDKGVPVMCCGQKMDEIIPGTVDASREKHIPVPVVNGNTVSVNVGSVDHPMVAEHYIMWVALETDKGIQIKYLTPDSAPSVSFALAEKENAKSVYAYCNLHGLWKADI